MKSKTVIILTRTLGYRTALSLIDIRYSILMKNDVNVIVIFIYFVNIAGALYVGHKTNFFGTDNNNNCLSV